MRGFRRQKPDAMANITRSDGSKPGIMTSSYLESLFSQEAFPSAVKEFVHPGKDPGELLMRCVFKDEREANAAVLFLSKCEEFGLPRHKQLLLHKLAATTSIKGLSRRELLQAVTGIVAPALFGEKEKGRRDGQ